MRVTIFGCGYSGLAIAKAFMPKSERICGTTRAGEKAMALSAAGIAPLLFQRPSLTDELAAALRQTTHLIQSIPPGKEGDPLVNLSHGGLRSLCPKLEWIGYLSTVGVYGDHGGGWVTEDMPGNPNQSRSLERLEAEAGWLRHSSQSGVPAAILRLSGIYGPGRNAFVNLARGTARRIVKKDQVFNRIRVEDIGRAALFLAERQLGGIYNVTDDEPGPPQDVVAEAARLMGIAPPAEQDFDTAEMTPMARSFYASNKRVSNAKIRQAGFSFRFPNYRMSLAELWQSGRWKA